MNRSLHSLRCQVGDLVMLVRSKDPARLGRIGVIICASKSAAASAIASPEDLPEVQRRDWVVDFQGASEVTYRDGHPVISHRFACADASLRPLRAAPEDFELETNLALGGAA
ncbi:hypothetical protein ACOTDT_19115 [Achromobacter xylosoxidans]